MRKSRLIMLVAFVVLAVVIAIFVWRLLLQKSDPASIIAKWKQNKVSGDITITYPRTGTLFPPEIAAPTFLWKEETQNVKRWLVTVNVEDDAEPVTIFTEQQRWKPDSLQWAGIKRYSLEKDAQVTVLGLERNKILSGASIVIRTSRDSVNASIFYRDVPLPFDFANKNLTQIRWRLGDITSNKPSRVMLKNLPVCGNCHSFTPDGKTMAMDVDYANDKGSYVISEIGKETVFSLNKIISWSEYRREDGESTFGLLSQISPDGRYAVSTVKDRSIFVPKDDLYYSQLFFPIKGILAIYDRKTKKFRSLPGANNCDYCQSNPNWTPDGKYIIFTCAPAYHSKEAEKYKKAVLPTAVAAEFIEGKRGFKYDIYRIPFNNGKGGKAVAIPGASKNGMSNYFPRISPDGKWLVFTRANNFMLLQPDSKLYIMPAEGGVEREMTCNMSSMNSWHSWSPNSKWLIFTSKERGAYTQLYLTHIDENGQDTPPVLIENFCLKKRAINIPEFVNISTKDWVELIDDFSDSSNYSYRVGQNELSYGDAEKAITAFTDAIKKHPEMVEAYLSRGVSKVFLKDHVGSIRDFNKALELKPDNPKCWVHRAVSKDYLGDVKGAVDDFRKALQLDPNNLNTLVNFGETLYKAKKYKSAIEIFNKILLIDSNHFDTYRKKGNAWHRLGNYQEAIKAFSMGLKLNSDDEDSYFARGYSLTYLKRPKEAINDFTKVIQLNPNNYKAFFNRGSARHVSGDLKGALEDLNMAIELKPDLAVQYYKRGRIKIALGRKEAGNKDLSKATQLGFRQQ